MDSLLNTIEFYVPGGTVKFPQGSSGIGEMMTLRREWYRRFEIATGVHIYVHSSIVAADIIHTLVDGYNPQKGE